MCGYASHQLSPIVQGFVVERQCCSQPLSQVVLAVQLHVIRVNVGLFSKAARRQQSGLFLTGLSRIQTHEVRHFLHTLPGIQLSPQLIVHIAQVGPGIEVPRVFFTYTSKKPRCTDLKFLP